jgi:putative transposase
MTSVNEAVKQGARFEDACGMLGLSSRTVERWRGDDACEDKRKGPLNAPPNKLADEERAHALNLMNSKEYRDLSPNQIVPKLADKGEFVASESTLYRILREEGMQQHRETSRAPANNRPSELAATAPLQVWSWDITYLPSPVRGMFFYLYMMVDVWSRKIVGWEVNESESMERSAQMMARVCAEMEIDPDTLSLHSDNGGPMKGATMLATLNTLGVTASFSRPSVSNDNPFSESLFRTLKYRPEYPHKPFESMEAAIAWVESFVRWYNTEHLHSGINFVTPEMRHSGNAPEILARRKEVYEKARSENPNRWSGKTRNWNHVEAVVLNPENRVVTKAA